jgi:YD repeat-containing protein
MQATKLPATSRHILKRGTSLAVLLVAVVVGNSALAQDMIPPKAYSVTPGGVNVADRSLVYSVTDLSLGSLKLERFHRTGQQQPNDPALGKNFSHNFDIYVAVNVNVYGTSDTVIVHLGNSASGTYSQQHSSPTTITNHNLDAEKGKLELVGGKFVYTDNDGTAYTFSSTVQADGAIWQTRSRRVERIDFPDGRVQTFSYNGSGYLKLVDDSAGHALIFDNNANGDATAACIFNRSQVYVTVSSTCAGAQLKTSYGYTGPVYPLDACIGLCH